MNWPICRRFRYPLSLLTLAACLLAAQLAAGSDSETKGPLTVAEKSDFRATSRSAEVVQFLDQLVPGAKHLHRYDFGRSVEDRPLQVVVVAQPPISVPKQIGKDKLIVLVLGNIHSGECAGKEAILMLLRELAQTPDHPWLKNLVLLFVPNYSADANDMVRLDNRPGQIGPVEGMGRRANAQGLDLNRDYMKLDSPECRALIKLVRQWDPHIFFDMHTTNGSWHRYALTYDIPHNPASPPAVRQYQRDKMMPVITANLEAKGIGTFYYGNFDREHTRWSTFGDYPRFGTEYIGLRGRMSVLAEAYAYIPYKDRIIASREFLRHSINYLASHSTEVRSVLDEVRNGSRTDVEGSILEEQVPIRSEVTPLQEKVKVRGYLPATSPRDRRTKPTAPHDYEVDFWTHFVPQLAVRRPHAYMIPATQTAVLERLRLHGIKMDKVPADTTEKVEILHITSLSRRDRVYQNRNLLQLEVEPVFAERQIAKGSYIVPTNQTLSNLIVYLLEPASNDGFAVWNVLEPELGEGDEYPIWRVIERK